MDLSRKECRRSKFLCLAFSPSAGTILCYPTVGTMTAIHCRCIIRISISVSIRIGISVNVKISIVIIVI